MFSLCHLSGDKLTQDERERKKKAPPCRHLRFKVLHRVTSPSLFMTDTTFLFIISPLAVCAFCGIAAGNVGCNRGWGACDGDWRAEPQSLPCSQGSQSGPALPQHPLRLSVQAVWTTESAQWQRTGLVTVRRLVFPTMGHKFWLISTVVVSFLLRMWQTLGESTSWSSQCRR